MFSDTDPIPNNDKQKAYNMIFAAFNTHIKGLITVTYHKDHIDIKKDIIKKFTINFVDEQTVSNDALKIAYTNYKELNDAILQMIRPVTPVKKSRFKNII